MRFEYASKCPIIPVPSVFKALYHSPSKKRAAGVIFTLNRPCCATRSKTGHSGLRSAGCVPDGNYIALQVPATAGYFQKPKVVFSLATRQPLQHSTSCLKCGWKSTRWAVYYSRNHVLICVACWIDFRAVKHFFQLFHHYAGHTTSCVLPTKTHGRDDL